MRYSLWLVLVGCLANVYAQEDTCDVEVDPNVYLFGYGYSFAPFEYLNDDGELMGLGYDITRSICKVMNRKCEHAVYYDYSYAYNDQGVSIALSDGWYDALVNWLPTPQRLSSYEFCSPFAKEPAAYMFVSAGSRMDTLDDIKRDADKFGFRTSFRTNPECLGNSIGLNLAGKEVYYDDAASMEAALQRGQVDVIFVDEMEIVNMNGVKRIGGEPIQCASGGMTIMFRKDVSLAWFTEGLHKLQANGDYEWICNMNANNVDPGCYDV